jgi:type IV secretory pathway TrbL component
MGCGSFWISFLALYLYVLSLCFGILLELFAISPTGHKFFDAVKKGMSIKNPKIKKAYTLIYKAFILVYLDGVIKILLHQLLH